MRGTLLARKKMAGYFTQGRGLAPRPTGSPRLAIERRPGLSPQADRPRRSPPQRGRKTKKEEWKKGERDRRREEKKQSGRKRQKDRKTARERDGEGEEAWGGRGQREGRSKYKREKSVRGPTLPSQGDRQHHCFRWTVQ